LGRKELGFRWWMNSPSPQSELVESGVRVGWEEKA